MLLVLCQHSVILMHSQRQMLDNIYMYFFKGHNSKFNLVSQHRKAQCTTGCVMFVELTVGLIKYDCLLCYILYV